MPINHPFKEGDRIRVLTGVYINKCGRVRALAEDVPKCVGVIFENAGSKEVLLLTWFQPNEIEKAG